MIYTETAAKTKLCPLPRAQSTPLSVDGVTFPAAPANSRCLATECMLFQETEPEVEWYMCGDTQTPQPPQGNGWTLGANNGRPGYMRIKERRGFCGLITR